MCVIHLLNQLKSGRSLLQSIQGLVVHSTGIVGTEFKKVLREYEAGMPLRKAMNSMKERVSSSDLHYLLNVLELYSTIGGDIGLIMNGVINTLKQRRLFRGEIKAKLSDINLSVNLVTLMPVAMGIFMWKYRPDLVLPLLSTTKGRYYLVYALISWSIGVLLIHETKRNILL